MFEFHTPPSTLNRGYNLIEVLPQSEAKIVWVETAMDTDTPRSSLGLWANRLGSGREDIARKPPASSQILQVPPAGPHRAPGLALAALAVAKVENFCSDLSAPHLGQAGAS
jgi:hypothetical protein